MPHGFGNFHSTEAIKGALPVSQNSPQHCPLNLYAEQLSGSAFTRARHQNLHSWLYRTHPSVAINRYQPFEKTMNMPFARLQSPNPMRFFPISASKIPHDFIDGLFHIAGNSGANTYLYSANQSMEKRYFVNRDGELLFVPVKGELHLDTEFGRLTIRPGMIAIIPRGIVFKMTCVDDVLEGYLCENKGLPLTLPQLGPIGANGLANPRHFYYPEAMHETAHQSCQVVCKYQDNLWLSHAPYSPLNVVAWMGNYAPYSYDLSHFNTINTVSFDHPDPSIFTVLCSESEIPGISNLDFVIFPPRYMVAEHTFRPPYFHRNIMNELMGLIEGEYDAKQDGFLPGGISIHNAFTPHGPDKKIYQAALKEPLKPKKYQQTLAFMFESNQPWLITDNALNHPAREMEYVACWDNFDVSF